MYVCTLFGALFGAPIVIRRAGWYGCVSSWICIYYESMYTSTRREYWEYYIGIYACMYACTMYVCMYVCTLFGAPIAIRRAGWYRCISSWICIYYEGTVQITFIFIGQTHLVFGKRVCTCVTKHSNAFRTFLNWLKNSKRVWHERKLQCKMHQTRWQVKRTSRLRLKRKLKSVWK